MSLENFENIDVFLGGFHSTSKGALEDLIEELKRENDIESVKEEEDLFWVELGIAIFIKLAASLVVALIKKTDAWDKLVDFVQKIFRKAKEKSSEPEKLQVILRYQTKKVTITSDSRTEIEEQLEILKKFI